MTEQVPSKEQFTGAQLYALYAQANEEFNVLVEDWAGMESYDREIWDRAAHLAAANLSTSHEPPAEDHARVWLIKERDEIKAAFKNFHRLLCERFGYCHDEKDWRRDQLSLIEHIAERATQPPSVWRSDPVIPAYEWVWVGSAYSSGYSGPFYHETTKKLSDYANADCWCLVAQPARPAATKGEG